MNGHQLWSGAETGPLCVRATTSGEEAAQEQLLHLEVAAVAQAEELRNARGRLGTPGASVRAAKIAEEMLGSDRA